MVVVVVVVVVFLLLLSSLFRKVVEKIRLAVFQSNLLTVV